MKKILILTADYGYGHRSAANAIAEALHETRDQECQVDIVNPLHDPRAPAFFKENQNDYDRMVREMPDLYKLGYQVGETRLVSSLIESTYTLTLFNVLPRSSVRNNPMSSSARICSTRASYPPYLRLKNATSHR
jgi:1,2-diacylglycerol 3-beta-galactosyltransferase